jgi:hypothetical protein
VGRYGCVNWERRIWYYEYVSGGARFRRPAETFDKCLAALVAEQLKGQRLRAVRIFEGGSTDYDTGIIRYDQDHPVVEVR